MTKILIDVKELAKVIKEQIDYNSWTVEDRAIIRLANKLAELLERESTENKKIIQDTTKTFNPKQFKEWCGVK